MKLDNELVKLKDIFISNGYPVDLINRIVKTIISQSEHARLYGPNPDPAFLFYHGTSEVIGNGNSKKSPPLQDQHITLLTSTWFTAVTLQAFTLKKNVLPPHQ